MQRIEAWFFIGIFLHEKEIFCIKSEFKNLFYESCRTDVELRVCFLKFIKWP